jgi:hypothetical protein
MAYSFTGEASSFAWEASSFAWEASSFAWEASSFAWETSFTREALFTSLEFHNRRSIRRGGIIAYSFSWEAALCTRLEI